MEISVKIAFQLCNNATQVQSLYALYNAKMGTKYPNTVLLYIFSPSVAVSA